MIAPPEIDITAGEDDGDVEFDAVVEVRPEVTLEGYDELAGRDPGTRGHRRDDRRAGRPAARALRRPRGLRRPAHRRRLRRDRHQGLRRRRGGRGPHRHRLPLRGRLRHGRARSSTTSCAASRPGAILEFNDDAARALRRARRRRGRVPGARQGGEAEGAARAHRRVGRRGERVRHRRRAARRHPQAPRHLCADAGADARRATRCSKRPPSSSTIDIPDALVDAGDGAPAARPRAPPQEQGDQT